MSSFSKNTIWSFLTEIAVFGLGFIYLIILARVLGPEGKGIYSLIILIPGLMISFGNFGIGAANVYFVGSKKHSIQNVISNSLVLAFSLGLILILVFWILTKFSFFQEFISSNKISSAYLWLVVLVIPISFLVSFFRSILLGKEKIADYNVTKLVEGFIQLLAVVILLIILSQGIFGGIVSYILGILSSSLIAVVFVRRLIKFKFSFSKRLLKDSAVYGSKVYGADALSFLNYRLDMFLIAVFLNPAAVGFYSIAVGIVERLRMVPGAFATVLFPRVSSLGEADANNFTPKIIRHTFFIMIVLSIFLLLLASPLVGIVFGSDFLPAVAPLIVLIPGIIAMGIGENLAADLAGRGKPHFAVYSSLLCLAINIPLNIILIPRIGIMGAALASTIGYWADTLVVLIAFLKISKKPLKEVLLINKEDFRDYLKLFIRS